MWPKDATIDIFGDWKSVSHVLLPTEVGDDANVQVESWSISDHLRDNHYEDDCPIPWEYQQIAAESPIENIWEYLGLKRVPPLQ